MSKKERLKLAQWAVEYARKQGAEQVAVTVDNERNVEIEYRDHDLEKIKESTSNGLGLTIYSKGKYSGHSTNNLRKDELKRFIEEAVAATQYLSADKFRMLPEPEFYPKDLDKDLKLKDPAYDSLQTEKRKAVAAQIAQVGKEANDKIISCTGTCGDVRYESIRVHSNGLEGISEGTVFWTVSSVTAKDSDSRPEDYAYGQCRFQKELPDPKTISEEAARRALAKIGQGKVASGRYDMLVENRAAARLLMMLRSPMTARALQQKRSWMDGKLDKQIASKALTIIDDPFIEGGLGSRLYDGEGLACKKRTIIEDGVLKSYLIDNYYGRKLGMKPNSGRVCNAVCKYGDKNLDEMVKTVDKGILVTGFNGGNSNSTTGDFSFGVSGFLIEKGKMVQPINEMIISGNAKEFFMKLVAMGNDPFKYSSMRFPSLHFEGVEFSGL